MRKTWTSVLLAVIAGLLVFPHSSIAAPPVATVLEVPQPQEIPPVSPRIVGGDDIEATWEVALAAGNRSLFDDQFCGGSLIAPNLVLTAAHCVIDDDSGELTSPINQYGLRVLIGQDRLNGSGGNLIYARRILYWPTGYDSTELSWDVALIELTQDATKGRVIKIAGPGEEALWTEGRPVWASGWGDLGDNTFPDHLQWAWSTIVGDAPCRAAWGGSHHWPTTLCAGAVPHGGRGTCGGDSGGPLAGKSSTGEWRLVGVTSFGLRPCGSRVPNGFARVAGETLRSAIQAAAQQYRPGVDVIGSGSGNPPPLDRFDALANAGIYVRWACDRSGRLCRGVKVRRCTRAGGSVFRCSVSTLIVRKRKRLTRTRTVRVTDRVSTISRVGVGPWRTVRGWR